MLGAGKLRGTGRLKFFCQICTKQCKDEHGWTCHINSASHKRKVEEFAENPEEIIGNYSVKFETNILQILRDKYSGRKVRLGELFKEFIDDRTYIDINMTRWKNLDEFWRYLREVKNVEIEGGFISWKEVELGSTLEEAREGKVKSQKTREEDNEWKFIERQIRKNKELGRYDREGEQEVEEGGGMETWNEKIEFTLAQPESKPIRRDLMFGEEQGEASQKEITNPPPPQAPPQNKKLNNLQKMILTLPEAKLAQKQSQPSEYQWILPGIQVKILPHDIDSKFHNKKASITRIHQPYVAELLCDGVTLRIDQTYLQSVIPKPGNEVRVLVGKYRGQKALLQKINAEEGFAILAIGESGLQLSCDEISKLA